MLKKHSLCLKMKTSFGILGFITESYWTSQQLFSSKSKRAAPKLEIQPVHFGASKREGARETGPCIMMRKYEAGWVKASIVQVEAN